MQISLHGDQWLSGAGAGAKGKDDRKQALGNLREVMEVFFILCWCFHDYLHVSKLLICAIKMD